jgi:hypothetical protein
MRANAAPLHAYAAADTSASLHTAATHWQSMGGSFLSFVQGAGSKQSRYMYLFVVTGNSHTSPVMISLLNYPDVTAEIIHPE